MKSTSRLRVLSDRIPRVLVFVYFCRGLSGNTEERSIRRDYRDINVPHNYLTSRRLQKRGPNGAWPWAPAQETRAPAPLHSPMRTLFRDYIPGSRIIVQSILVWSNGPYSLEGTIKPDLLAPGGESLSTLIHYSSREKKPLIKPRATTSIRHLD